MDEAEVVLARFREAAVAWAGGGRSQDLIDAAASALAGGLDSPSLRVLAGAPRRYAGTEAAELAPQAFLELGLSIEPRLSAPAIVEHAHLLARNFLDDGSGDPRSLARTLSRMYVEADYHAELNDWSGLDEHYALIEEGVIQGSSSDVDAEVLAAARALRGRRR